MGIVGCGQCPVSTTDIAVLLII